MSSLAFLTPLFLYGALAALIPLLLHLIKRERAQKRVFSTLRFLKASPHEVIRQQKLRRLLLLLLRMAAFALLAAIFARPFIRDSARAAMIGPKPRAVAILLDTSYSMGLGGRLERAKQQALELIRSVHHGDQVVLIEFSTQGHVLKELSPETGSLPGAIASRVMLSHRATNYLEALRLADDHVNRSGFTDRTIFLISDFQKAGWEHRATGWKLSPGVVVKAIDVSDDQDANAAVTDVDIPGHLSRSERTQEVAVRVKNFGHEPYQGSVELTVNGRLAATKPIAMLPRSGQVVTFQHTFDQDKNAGLIAIGDDALPVDNRLYFTFDVPSPIRVLCVEERAGRPSETNAGYYLSQALGLRTDPPITVDIRPPAGLGNVAFSGYQAIVLADVATLDRTAIARLTEYVKSGGGLMIGLGDRVSSHLFNTALSPLVPARLQDVWPPTINRDVFRSLAEVDYRHPVFLPFAGPHHGDFGTARFFRIGRVAADSTAMTLGRYDDGSPAFIERSLGQGRVLLFTSTLNLDWNDLPIRGVYVPFLYQTVDYLAGRLAGGDGKVRRYHLIGEAVRLPVVPPTVVTRPASQPVTMAGSSSETVLYTGTDEPGLYRVGPDGRDGHFAVNVDTRESDLTHLDVEEMVAAVTNPITESEEAQALKAQANLEQNTELERRQRMWWYLSLGLLVLVLGETLLASRTHR